MSKISIDLRSRSRGLADWNKLKHPTSEQLNQIFQVCTLAIDQLGEIAKFLEVIKVSFYQCYTSSYLDVTLRAVLIDPRRVKFKFEASCEEHMSGDISKVRVELITSSLVKKIKEAISRQAQLTQQACDAMQSLIKESAK